MSAIEDSKTLGRARLSFAKEADIDEFVEVLGRFERGEITPDEWRAFRLVRGTYGQRQTADAQMLRVKIPQGVLDVAQLEAMAEVAERYSRGFGHITTRQNIQLHFLKLHDVELAMRDRVRRPLEVPLRVVQLSHGPRTAASRASATTFAAARLPDGRYDIGLG